jgi:hypothetical protein
VVYDHGATLVKAIGLDYFIQHYPLTHLTLTP